MRPPAPRRPLNPFLLKRAVACGINQKVLASVAGWPSYSHYYSDIRSSIIIATDLTVARLTKLAKIISDKTGIEFPADEIFLDEPMKPRLVKRKSAALDQHSETTAADAEASR